MIRVNKKFVILALLAFVCAFILGGNLPYAIFYTFLVILILESLYMKKIWKNFYLSLDKLKENYTVGDKCYFTILVKSYSMPYVYIENSLLKLFNKNYNGHCLFMDSSGSEIINIDLELKYRGIYDLGKFDITVYDLFNIFYLKANKYIKNKSVKIYPKIHLINESSVVGKGNLETASKRKNYTVDNSSIKDIRKYVVGDSLKKIHWKLSAKHKELYVKNYDEIQGKRCNIFLNMERSSLPKNINNLVEEDSIETCVSLVNFMNNNGINSKIFINDKKNKIIKVSNKNSFNEFMEIMLTVKSSKDILFEEFLNVKLMEIHESEIIYIITFKLNKDMFEILSKLNRRSYNVTLIYNYYDIDSLKYVKKLNKLGINCIYGKLLIKDN